MQKRRWLTLLMALVLTLSLAGGVLAQEADEVEAEEVVEAELISAPVEEEAAEPVVLADDSPVAGTLAGNRGGSFDYYVIEYPGNDVAVNIRIDFAPGDPATLMAVGFNVYGDDGFFIGTGAAAGAAKELMYSSSTAETWLVQVYNYGDVTVSYTIAAEGLPAAADDAEEAEEVAVVDEADEAEEVAATEAVFEEGTLVGSRAGAFVTIEIEYDGESDMDLTLTYAPDDPTYRAGIGMTVYGADGWSLGSTVADGVRTASLTGEAAGTYIVQVFNYVEGLEIAFTLSN